jgi:hypothetical protein
MAIHPRFERRDWNGYRKDKGHVFTCACGCGGHVLITPQQVGTTLAIREHEQKVYGARPGRQGKDGEQRGAMVAGDSFYVDGHEPMGLHEARTGSRVALRATS